MNKKEFVAEVAVDLGIPASQANLMVDVVFNNLIKAVAAEGKVKLPVGVFSMAETKERSGRNPKTGETLVIPAKKKIKFRMSKTITDALS